MWGVSIRDAERLQSLLRNGLLPAGVFGLQLLIDGYDLFLGWHEVLTSHEIEKCLDQGCDVLFAHDGSFVTDCWAVWRAIRFQERSPVRGGLLSSI
jgi:hypothetical protein